MRKVRLSSILSEQPRNGWSPPLEYQTGSGVPVLTLSSVTGFDYDGTKVKLTSAPTKEDAHYWLRPGELLLTRSNTRELVGHVAIYDGNPTRAICCDLIMKMAVDGRRASTRYVYYYLRSPEAREHLMSRAHGASSTMKKLSKQMVQDILVPLPPLEEQRRIVSVLDEAFAGIAIANGNAEKNLQNARTLLSSSFDVVATGEEQRHWATTTVAALAKSQKGSIRTGPFGSQLLHGEFVNEGVAVLGIDNVVANEFRWARSRFVAPEKYSELRRYRVYPGDVLITIMGTCGRCAVVPDQVPLAINTKHLCCITLEQTRCLPNYLHMYFLYHPVARSFLDAQSKGAIMDGLNMQIIKELPVLLPPVERQRELISLFGSLKESTEHLASTYQRKLSVLEDLKKSLLREAFNGNL